MTTPIRVNSPVLRIPVAATAWRAAAIEVPCTITVVLPVSPPSCPARKSETLARSAAGAVACPAAGAVAPTPKVALAASTLAAQARRVLGRTLSSRGVEVIQSLNERTGPGSRPYLPRIHRRVARRVGTGVATRLRRPGQWGHDRAPPQGCRAHGPTRCAPARLCRPAGDGARQAARRQARRRGALRGAAAHRRAALPHPGRAQGRCDEVRPGPQRAGVRPARGGQRALPRAPHRAAGLRSPDADGDRARAADHAPRRRLVRTARLARRCPDGGRVDRAGPPRPLARPRGRAGGGGGPRGRREGAVPRRRRGADVRPPPDLPRRARVRAGVPRHRPQAARRGAAGPRCRRARLPPRGGGAGGVRRGLRRPPRHRRARGRHRRRPRCS